MRGLTSGLVLLIVLAVVAAFLPVLQNGFVEWDDDENLIRNVDFRGLGADQLRWMFTTRLLSVYQPLSWLVFACQYVVFGLRAVAFHAVSGLLHAAGMVALYFVALRILRAAYSAVGLTSTGEPTVERAARVGAAATALFHGLHPLRVECVAWASAQPYLVAALPLWLCLLAYVKAQTDGAGFRRRWLGLSLACYVVSLLAKSIGVPLPLWLLLLDLYPLRRLPLDPRGWSRRAVRDILYEKLPFAVVAAAAVLAGIWANAGSPLHGPEPALRIVLISCYALVFYLWKTILPLGLSPVYELPAGASLTRPILLVCPIILLALLVVAWRVRRVRPWATVAIAAYVVQLLPVLGFVRHTDQIAADRYTYLACVSLALIFGGLCGRAWQAATPAGRIGRPAALLAPAALMAVLAVLTAQQARVWRDSVSLWEHALAQPDTTRLGDSKIAHSNLGVAYGKAGDYERGARHLRRAAELAPGEPEIHVNLGNLHRLRGEHEEAVREFRVGLEMDVRQHDVWHALGQSLVRLGRPRQALEAFERALELAPEAPEYLTDMAWLLATTRAPRVRNPARAVDLAERAVQQTGGQSVPALRALAAALSQVDRFADAAATAEQALRVARESGLKDAVPRIQVEIERYRNGGAFGSSQ